MAITPQDIQQQTFSRSKPKVAGYDVQEVDAFLERVATEVDAMLQKIADLKNRLNASEQQLAQAQTQVAQLEEQQSNLQATQIASEPIFAEPSANAVAATPEPASPSLTATERQISQVLIVAQQSADKIVEDARANAERIQSDADQKAREVIRQALAEKQHELDEIDRLKQSREAFRTEYRTLLQHFMDDAESVLPRAEQPKLAIPQHQLTQSNTSGPAPVGNQAYSASQSAVLDAAPASTTAATSSATSASQTSLASADFSDLD